MSATSLARSAPPTRRASSRGGARWGARSRAAARRAVARGPRGARGGKTQKANAVHDATSGSDDARNHDECRVYVRSLTGIGRRAALMATVGGLSLGSRCEGSVAASEEDLPRDPSLLPTVDDVVAGTIESQSPATVPAREGLGVGADANAEGDPWEGSYVKPALTVPEYLDEIQKERGAAFETLRRLAINLKFSQLDNELLLAPFDDVKQAAFFLPWALVKLDETAGVDAQNAYLRFRERLVELDATAIDATRYVADEDDVLAAVSRVEAALDDIIAAVPASRAR